MRDSAQVLLPVVGDAVSLVDGTPVGIVTRVADRAFQVTSGVLLLWIRSEAVLMRRQSGLRLCCGLDELPRYAGPPRVFVRPRSG